MNKDIESAIRGCENNLILNYCHILRAERDSDTRDWRYRSEKVLMRNNEKRLIELYTEKGYNVDEKMDALYKECVGKVIE